MFPWMSRISPRKAGRGEQGQEPGAMQSGRARNGKSIKISNIFTGLATFLRD